MPGGQPTKYKPEYCEQLIEHFSRGKSFDAFAGVLRVNPDTIYEWAKKHKEFSEAKKIGQGISRNFWEDMGIDGVEIPGFNTALWIFNMKNRFGWRDRQPDEEMQIQIQNNNRTVVQMISKEEKLKLLKEVLATPAKQLGSENKIE